MHHCASSLYTRELKVIVLYQPFQNRTIPRPAPPHLPPLSKVRCCRPKEFGRLPEGLPQLHRPSPSPQPLQKDNSTLLRTTFLPYERSVGFASHCLVSHQCRCVLQRLSVADFMHPCLKLWAFNFGHPCPSLVKGEVLSPS